MNSNFRITTSFLSNIATPAGQLPVLEVDGGQICQSMAIARFLANKFGLAGTTPIEKAQADMVVDCVQDFFTGKVVDRISFQIIYCNTS